MITGTVTSSKPLLIKSLVTREEVSALRSLKIKKSFLYIGNNSDRTTNCFSFFNHGFVCPDYEEAKGVLVELYENGILPDFVIVDLPLNEQDIFQFVLWLHSNKWSFMIPVLYNETILDEEALSLLKNLNVADDIIDMEHFCQQLVSQNPETKGFRSVPTEHGTTENQKAADYRIKTPVSKRIFDIVLSSILLIALLPLFLIIALIIKLESKGPVLYKSKRAGRGFKVFNFYKFRSMVHNADQKMDEYIGLNLYAGRKKDDASFIKIKNDPRVTRFGSFLRNTSLDELPQLFNVLKGDMSIVGNRPLPLYEAATLTTDKNAERFVAPAGITGLWQVTKRGHEDMKTDERICLDISYARQQGFLMDCRILMMTPLALFQKSNV